jgi:hypothetical protein
VTDSIFTNNSAADSGGAIANGTGGGGTVTVADSTFSKDTAVDGGAIGNAGVR